MDLLSAVTALVELLKTAKFAGDAAIHAATSDLVLAVARARDELATKIQENVQLKDENLRLSEQLRLRSEMRADGNTYWRVNDAGRDGPFCMPCFDTKGLLVRLFVYNTNDRVCPSCRSYP